MKRGENDIKEEQAPTNALRSERNPQSDKKTKQLKPKFASKTVLQKSLTKQNKNKKSRDTEIETGRQNRNWHISSKITRLTFLYIGSFFTHPMLASFFMWGVSLHIPCWLLFLCGEFLSHIPYWLHFYVGSFSYTSHAGLIFIWGVSPTHPMLASFLCVEFLLHIPCWLHFYVWSLLHFLSWLHFYVGSFSYTSCADFFKNFISGEFLLHIPRWLNFFLWGVSLTHPVLASYLYGVFLLNVRYWLCFYLGSLSYTSHACFLFLWGVCFTHPEMVLSPPPPPSPSAGCIFYTGSFSYIPCWLLIYLFISGSFSYTSRAGFIFPLGVSLTHPILFDVSVGSFSYTSHDGFFFFFPSFLIWGVSLTHPVVASYLCGEFILHIPYWHYFYVGSFPYTSHACFLFLWGVCLTHPQFSLSLSLSLSLSPELVSILCGEFLLHIPCRLLLLLSFFFFNFFISEFLLHILHWLDFSVGSFSYTSHASFCFCCLFVFCFLVLIWEVSLTHPVLASYLCGEFLLQIPYWLYFYLGSFSYTSLACFLFLWGVCLIHP